MKKLTLPLFLLLSTILFSQKHYPVQSHQTLVYKLTNEQAQEIYAHPNANFELKETYLNNLVDSFYLASDRKQNNGHFLLVNVLYDEVIAQLESKNSITVKAINNKRDFAVQVADSLGQSIDNAAVMFVDKRVSFDKKTKLYRLKKWNKDGLLSVKALDETIFYQVKKSKDGSIFFRKIKRFSRTKFGQVVTLPMRLPIIIGRRIGSFFKRGFSRNQWHLRNLFPKKQKRKYFKGYLAFNKPKYQPRDTVKIKAYITNTKGKPIKDDLQLQIGGNFGSRKLLNKLVKPTIPGNFEYEFVLADSVKLDVDYQVVFRRNQNRPKGQIIQSQEQISNSFHYEDYELDEVSFDFKNAQEIYQADEKIIFLAEGQDKNKLTIPDGEIRLTLLRNYASNYQVEEVRIPDTLWVHQQALSPRGETQIVVPDSIFPQVDMKVQAVAVLSNANGEAEEKKSEFQVLSKRGKLEIETKNGILTIAYLENGQSSKKQATLIQSSNYQDNIHQETKIELPFSEPLNPFTSSYLVKTENLISTKHIYENRHLGKIALSVKTQRTADSVLISFNNIDKIPFTYLIQKGNQEIARGQVDSTDFLWQRQDRSSAIYHLKYNYIYGGKTTMKEETIRGYKKLLNLEIEQPKIISPGETIELKIKAKNYKNKAAQNVNLVAGSVNAQFPTDKHLRTPRIEYKLKKEPFVYNTFTVRTPSKRQAKSAVSKRWFNQFGLDSLLYYQLLRPENGAFFHTDSVTSDTFYREVAQFAPYLVKDGEMQPIYLIYCNRKLVYWQGTTDNAPYSFIGQAGKNTISVRGQEYEYTVKVNLKKGEKLEFSIDENNLQKAKDFTKISKIWRSDKLTEQEKALVKSTTLILKNLPQSQGNWQKLNRAVIQQNNQIHLVEINRLPTIISPFYESRKDSIIYKHKTGWSNIFSYDAGFSYEIFPTRERLYKTEFKDYYGFEKLEARRILFEQKRPGNVVHSLRDAERYLSENQEQFPWTKMGNVENDGIFAFKLPPDSLFKAIVLVKNDTTHFFYKGTRNYIYSLLSGTYKFYAFTNAGSYQIKEIEIHANELYFKDFVEEPFLRDSNHLILKELLKKWNQFAEKETIGLLSSIIKPTNQFGANNSVLTGVIMDEMTRDELAFSTVIAYQDDKEIAGVSTGLDGTYLLELPTGIYDIEVSYLGYKNSRTTNIFARENQSTYLNIALSEETNLLEVAVVSSTGAKYNRAGIRRIINSESLFGRKVETQFGKLRLTSANSKVDNKTTSFGIRGSRANATNYYLDGMALSDRDPVKSNLRTQFTDYAFWQPTLITDQNGEAYFQATFPDNVTSWRTFVMGMDDKNRGGTAFAETRAFKQLMGQLALPRFLIEGDETEIIGKSVNYTNDTFPIETTFRLGDNILQKERHQLSAAVIEKIEITAAAPTDSLQLSYALKMENYLDGEERFLPVFAKGTMETVGDFYLLEQDTNFVVTAKLFDTPLVISIMDDALDLMLEEISYLQKYPYGCNEQVASKLMASLMEKQIRTQLGEHFDGEEAIFKALGQLKKTQNPRGFWGWWSGGKEHLWMSSYVLKALHQAAESGYQSTALEKGLKYMTFRLNGLKSRELLQVLDVFSDVGQNIDYQKHIEKIDTSFVSLYDRFLLIKIKQSARLTYSLDSLFKYQKETTFGSLYWGEDDYGFYDNSIQTTLLAYQIFKKSGREDICKKIRQYFLQKNVAGGFSNKNTRRFGRNTFETTQIVATILPDILKEQTSISKSILQINNEVINTFPQVLEINVENLRDELAIKKTGNGQLYLSMAQQFQNNQPTAKTDLFDLKTTLQQNGKIVENGQLEKAIATKLIVSVEVKKAADFVMIEIPIPAGCSYGDKMLSLRYYNGVRSKVEVHREYFKEKTAIFCEQLPVGKYEFTINLEPRFTGKYTLNPTKIEQMYFPIFYGRNGMKEVTVE